MPSVNTPNNLKTTSCRRLFSGLIVLLTICLHCVVWNAWLSKTSIIRSSTNSASTSSSRPLPLRRAADDGQWMSQRSPFVVHVYSAFYDDRLSLGPLGPLVTVIVSIPEEVQRIRHCRLWYDADDDGGYLTEKPSAVSSSPFVIGSLVAASTNIVLCQVPKNTSAKEDYRTGNDSRPRTAVVTNVAIPIAASLAWGLADNEATDFHVPIERMNAVNDRNRERGTERLDRKQLSRRKLAVCGTTLYGDDIEPRLIVEWFQMLRLLGVEHVVLYNHSVADRVGHIVADYAARQRQEATGGFTVELRQTRRFGSDQVEELGWFGRELFRHQIPILNDCYYRLANWFQYIGVFDVDELIIPRNNSTWNIVELIEVEVNVLTKLFAIIIRQDTKQFMALKYSAMPEFCVS